MACTSKLWWTTLSSRNTREAHVIFNPAFSRSLSLHIGNLHHEEEMASYPSSNNTKIFGSFLNFWVALSTLDVWLIRRQSMPFCLRATSTTARVRATFWCRPSQDAYYATNLPTPRKRCFLLQDQQLSNKKDVERASEFWFRNLHGFQYLGCPRERMHLTLGVSLKVAGSLVTAIARRFSFSGSVASMLKRWTPFRSIPILQGLA